MDAHVQISYFTVRPEHFPSIIMDFLISIIITHESLHLRVTSLVFNLTMSKYTDV